MPGFVVRWLRSAYKRESMTSIQVIECDVCESLAAPWPWTSRTRVPGLHSSSMVLPPARLLFKSSIAKLSCLWSPVVQSAVPLSSHCNPFQALAGALWEEGTEALLNFCVLWSSLGLSQRLVIWSPGCWSHME